VTNAGGDARRSSFFVPARRPGGLGFAAAVVELTDDLLARRLADPT
jgi:hypothetical protein